VDEDEEQAPPKVAAAAKQAAAAAPAKKAPAAAGQKAAPRADKKAEDRDPAADLAKERRGGNGGGRPPRVATQNDRHVARNGKPAQTARGGSGRGNWGGNNEAIADGLDAVKGGDNAEASSPAAVAADAAVESTPEPVSQEPDPLDKLLSLDEFLAKKEALRVAEDLKKTVRAVIVDEKQFKKALVIENKPEDNDFTALAVKKNKDKRKNQQTKEEAVDFAPVGAVAAPRPARFDSESPRSRDGQPFPRGGRGGRGRGGGGRGGARGGSRGAGGANLRMDDASSFPSLPLGSAQ